MYIRIARSARKHKIGNAHIIAAIRNADEPTLIDDQMHFIGHDDRGLELHVIMVPDDRREGRSRSFTPCRPMGGSDGKV